MIEKVLSTIQYYKIYNQKWQNPINPEAEVCNSGIEKELNQK